MVSLLLLACVDYDLRGGKADDAPDDTVADSGPDSDPGDDTGIDTGDSGADTGPDTGDSGGQTGDSDPACPDPWLGVSTVDTDLDCPPVALALTEEWSDLTLPGSLTTPAVGHLDDENGDGLPGAGDIPEIVYVAYDDVYALAGDGSGVRWRYSPGDLVSTNPAIADLDGDDWPEVIVAVGGTMLAILDGATGAEEHRTDPGMFDSGNPEGRYGAIGVWDLDADGSPELVCGQAVWSADGALLFQLSAGTGSPQDGYAPMSTAADLDGDGLLEIVGGNSLYAHDGTLRWTAEVDDGRSAVADFDGDGQGEVVVGGFSGTSLLGGDGAVWWTSSAGTEGPPVVADFDGDGLPEVGAAGNSRYWMIDTDGSILWHVAIVDVSSGYVGSAAADLDGDGRVEVIVADEEEVRVLDGSTGAELATGSLHCSGTVSEYAPVVDVDGDGGGEIVVAHNSLGEAKCPDGITVQGPERGQWQPMSEWWNQTAYATVHVEEHGHVPAAPTESWLVHNTFRTAPLTLAPEAPRGDAIVDGPTVCDDECGAGWLELVVRVGNTDPERTLPAGIPVTVYGAAGALGTAWTTLEVPPGATSEGLPFRLESAAVGATFTVVVDDDGTGAGRVEECDEADNARSVDNPCE